MRPLFKRELDAPRKRRTGRVASSLVGLLVALHVTTSVAAGREASAETEAPDPLAARGHVVTSGAAPGYVDDRLCGSCHRDLFDSFQEVGMGRSFFKPRPSNLIEDFSQSFYHQASGRYYEMVERDGRLAMKRYQLDDEGERINAVEQEIDWILGSGNHSRTYLYRTPQGDLFQLPIAWYTQTRSWGMAPGFDRADHLGLLRRVRRECMFCHNAYPDVPAASDDYAAPHRFPAELPEGVGCQRCHGPGAAHSRAAMRDEVDFEEVYATILNPGTLEPRLRDDVCYQCHMQPTVAIPGQRRFGRKAYSFRPGEPLDDYLVQVDIDEAGQSRDERFEINHHPYRLEQSPCFIASAGAMSCLSCHDPHRKVPEAERVAHYRAACLECHEVDACRLEEMSAGDASFPAVAADDCAGCHMPKRRTQDVVNVVMTDHFIRRRPGGPELLAPLAEREVTIDDVEILESERAPRDDLAKLYRAFAVAEFSGGGYGDAIVFLERILPRVRPAEHEPYLALARGQLKQLRPAAARRTLEGLLERAPGHPLALELLGLAESKLGRPRHAVARALETLKAGHERPETLYNLGVVLLKYWPEGALARLERATLLRPTMDAAWFYRGKAEAALDRRDDAARSFRQAVALNPTHGEAYLALGEILKRQGRHAEALRYLRHGAEHATDPAPLVEALENLEQANP